MSKLYSHQNDANRHHSDVLIVNIEHICQHLIWCFYPRPWRNIDSWDPTTTAHINSETNPPPPSINVVCKYLRQFLGAGFRVAALPLYCNIEQGRGAWFISPKWTIPEFPEIFPGITWSQYCRSNFVIKAKNQCIMFFFSNFSL